MKTAFSAVMFVLFSAVTVFAAKDCRNQLGSDWDRLTKAEQASILNNIDYASKKDLPKGTKVVAYANDTAKFKVTDIKNKAHQTYIKKILKIFDKEADRGEVENSEFKAHGSEVVTGLFLLLDNKGEILGSLLNVFQDGRDEDGEAGDINWQARAIFDEKGISLEDLIRFEWSGH